MQNFRIFFFSPFISYVLFPPPLFLSAFLSLHLQCILSLLLLNPLPPFLPFLPAHLFILFLFFFYCLALSHWKQAVTQTSVIDDLLCLSDYSCSSFKPVLCSQEPSLSHTHTHFWPHPSWDRKPCAAPPVSPLAPCCNQSQESRHPIHHGG